jgi:hypothetical protein
MTDLDYNNPKDLGIKKIHELLFGIEWFENEKNKETYKKEVRKIVNAK